MTFELGVDESSLCEFDRTGPACHCRVVMDSVLYDINNNETVKNIYDSGLFNYRKKEAGGIELSDVEILRITAYWEYDVSSIKQNSLNLAIVNPTLYLKPSTK